MSNTLRVNEDKLRGAQTDAGQTEALMPSTCGQVNQHQDQGCTDQAILGVLECMTSLIVRKCQPSTDTKPRRKNVRNRGTITIRK
ncbi:hypothetical protein NP493_543g02000 [Ridgeia piscesae]|uniref:Uncharacterized protein n=1 Tax=Ridgeia piscesae TaxID=27915 RepID=A0AAD9NQA4_RIDPI|nr:hypothetical protein NP493_543g02000 [Ridgeia piscesae]